MWDVCSNIVIGLSVLDMWSVLFVMYMCDVCSNIVIGLNVLDMWSVLLCSMYVGRMGSNIAMIIRTVAYWTCGQCCLLYMWDGMILI